MKTVTFTGTPYQLGYKLGQQAKGIFSRYIKTSHHFTKLERWRESEWLISIDKQIQQQFPRVYQELQGLAEGAEQPYQDILLWNCRGDLLPTGPEGCTSIGVQKDNHAIVAHNEDGDPELNGHCFLLDATMDNGVRIFSFAYPGSIPGHTICANSYGLVYTVNNIRLTEQGQGIPRMIVSRALLESASCDDFIQLLNNTHRSGGFHYTVADQNSLQPLSVEAPFHSVSVYQASPIVVHANHLVHDKLSAIPQNITDSSFDRQTRMEALAKKYQHNISQDECFAILQDRADGILPIFRTEPDDPDEENTLATGIFTLKKNQVEAKIYTMEEPSKPVVHHFSLL